MRRAQSLAVLLCGAGAILPMGGAFAQVTTIPSLTATVGGAYSTNPFLTSQGDDAASVQFDVQPMLQVIDGADQATIAANYNRADYLSRYGSNSGYGATLSATKRPNARTTFGVTAAYDSQILGAQNGFITPISPIGTGPVIGVPTTGTGVDVGTGAGTTPVVTTPIVNPVTPVLNNDVGLIGLRQRRNSLSAGVNASYASDARSTWNAGLNAQRSTYPGQNNNSLNAFATDLRSYTASVGYTRSVSEVSSVGVQLTANYVDYANGFKSQIYNPRLTYNRELSEIYSLSLSVGAGITHDDQIGTRTTVSVDGSLCRQGERLRGCVTGSRTPTATGFGGVRVQTSLGANLGYQIGENTSAAATANYIRLGSAQNALFPGQSIDGQDLFNSNLSLQRRLGRMFAGVASVGYRTAGGLGNIAGSSGGNIPGDITGRLGVTVFLGQR